MSEWENAAERGQVLVIVVLLLGLLIALVGLAVDGAVLYVRQARLQTVADAAALAAAGALLDPESPLPPPETARRAAELYVRLNAPAPQAHVQVRLAPLDDPPAWQVTVTLTQTVPLHFLPVVNIQSARLSASAAAQRSLAGPDLVLALDASRCRLGGLDWRCAEIRQGAWTLAQNVLEQGGRVGVIEYRRTARLLLPPTAAPQQVRQALERWGRGRGGIAVSRGERNLGDALWLATRTLAALPDERPRGVLLLATGAATVGRNCCAECRCARDGLAVCGRRCPARWCCDRWAQEMAFHAWEKGVFVMSLDGTGSREGTELMRSIADLSDDGRRNGTATYYLLVGKEKGHKPRRGDFLAALNEAARRLPGDFYEGVNHVRLVR